MLKRVAAFYQGVVGSCHCLVKVRYIRFYNVLVPIILFLCIYNVRVFPMTKIMILNDVRHK